MELMNKKDVERKEVKRMKGICASIIAVLFVLGAGSVVSAEPTTSMDKTIHIEYMYNPYGVLGSSLEKTTTETTTATTTTIDGEEVVTTSTSTTIQTVTSSWKGGSLKVDSIAGTTNTTGDDESSSSTTFSTAYDYDELGRLEGASGDSTTTGDSGNDSNGQAIGTYASRNANSYVTKNGQIMTDSSTTNSTNYAPDGTVESTSTQTTTYTYELKGGNWVIAQETTTTNTSYTNGGSATVTKVKNYARDGNGVCTGITQTASGSQTVKNSYGGNVTFTMRNYQATFTYDTEAGYYLASEKWNWQS